MKKQWMTAFGLIGMIAAIIWACHKEQPVTITPAEQQLSLVSPEGYALAGSVAELKTQLAEDVSKRLNKTIDPGDVTIHDIQYMGDERVRAASILFASPEGRHSVLHILHLKPGMTLTKKGEILVLESLTNAEFMSAQPDIPRDFLCEGDNCCHWIWDPLQKCAGEHVEGFICACECGNNEGGGESEPAPDCWIMAY